MATSEALIKYYDCLKDSFNKIQEKSNKTALENAALRPKIREEFVKSREVLNSYLDYIQIFSVVYSDKFPTICMNIIVPLFKEDEIKKSSLSSSTNDDLDYTEKIHRTLKAIISSKPELALDFIHSVVKVFPSINDDREEKINVFTSYLRNCLKVCAYVEGESLTILIAKILEKLNPPILSETSQDEDEILRIRKILDESYRIVFDYLTDLEESQLKRLSETMIRTFVTEYLASRNENHLNHLLLYLCSRDPESADLLITSLWNIFSKPVRSTKERKASVMFASSFIARANYLNLDKVFDYLEKSTSWCEEFLKDSKKGNASSNQKEELTSYNEGIDSFYTLFQSILYLITQRYREMYEEESISKLRSLNLDQIINCSLKPLEICDKEIESRFQEVAALYNIAHIESFNIMNAKRRKSELSEFKMRSSWVVPFDETGNSVPEQIKEIYRCYHSHRIFTVYRE